MQLTRGGFSDRFDGARDERAESTPEEGLILGQSGDERNACKSPSLSGISVDLCSVTRGCAVARPLPIRIESDLTTGPVWIPVLPLDAADGNPPVVLLQLPSPPPRPPTRIQLEQTNGEGEGSAPRGKHANDEDFYGMRVGLRCKVCTRFKVLSEKMGKKKNAGKNMRSSMIASTGKRLEIQQVA